MGERDKMPMRLKWHPKSTDQEHNGSIYHEPHPGHAYAVAMQPKYVSDEQWKLYAESICTSFNTCIAVDGLVKALMQCQSALAMVISPHAIKTSSVQNAFTQATEAECKARAALSRFRELQGGGA